LAYNRIQNPTLMSLTKNFPNLFCCDLSFNELCDFGSAIIWIERLQNLKILYLAGNPMALTYKYREIVKQHFSELKFLDGKLAFTEAEENQKKKLKKKLAT
jgi:hypothetical protein